MTLAASLALWALCGCTPMAWVKEDSTPQQVSEDLGRCQQDAWQEARAYNWYYRPMSPAFASPMGGRFFVSPGAPYYDPFYDPAMQEARLTQFCMKNKGYELKRVEQDD
jgi:hypothetical protein